VSNQGVEGESSGFNRLTLVKKMAVGAFAVPAIVSFQLDSLARAGTFHARGHQQGSDGDHSYGNQSVGNQTVGNQTIGNQTYGNQTIGNQTVPDQSVGNQTIGNQTPPKQPPPKQDCDSSHDDGSKQKDNRRGRGR
jgi:hypothetical protein